MEYLIGAIVTIILGLIAKYKAVESKNKILEREHDDSLLKDKLTEFAIKKNQIAADNANKSIDDILAERKRHGDEN